MKKVSLLIVMIITQFCYGQNFELTLEKAELGDAKAQYEIGQVYEFGKKGMSKNIKKAIFWYEKSAIQNIQGAQYRLGLIYDQEKGVLFDKQKAIFWFKKNAENGNSNTQIRLARMYYNGDSVDRDYEQSFYWFKKFAEQELKQVSGEMELWNGEIIKGKFYDERLPTVMNLVGISYNTGLGVLVDKKQAFYWFEKSAEYENSSAQLQLGKMYITGDSGKIDLAKAAFWVKKSYENGNEEAKLTWDKYELWKY
ncbi:MAG: sel1 repeat family protein [Flavobacteriaceae bacterium]|nr:sel1 repeat family protein [Flavobacteriaceae bacterium]